MVELKGTLIKVSSLVPGDRFRFNVDPENDGVCVHHHTYGKLIINVDEAKVEYWRNDEMCTVFTDTE